MQALCKQVRHVLSSPSTREKAARHTRVSLRVLSRTLSHEGSTRGTRQGSPPWYVCACFTYSAVACVFSCVQPMCYWYSILLVRQLVEKCTRHSLVWYSKVHVSLRVLSTTLSYEGPTGVKSSKSTSICRTCVPLPVLEPLRTRWRMPNKFPSNISCAYTRVVL